MEKLEPRSEKRTQWVQDAWTGEMVKVEVDALVFDLSALPAVAAGDALTFSYELNLTAP